VTRSTNSRDSLITSKMSELDVRKELSNKTVDVLVDIIIQLLKQTAQLEKELELLNAYDSANGT